MTIKDLAAQTGYSLGTVSRVLNNQPNVSNRAREVILKAAKESGFQLNANAKQLKQHRGTSVLVICKGNNNQLFSSLLEELQSRVAQMKYPLVVDYIDENENEVRQAIRLCQEKKPLGVLFLGGSREHFRRDFHHISLPCVLVTNDAADLAFPNLSSVTSDDALAGEMAIDYLVSLGHRKIVLIGGERETSDTARKRFEGAMAAFEKHSLAFDPERDYESIRFSYEDGYQAARTLLCRNREFTAVFAMSDVMAIGAIRALEDAGKRVPRDVSVVGFDGLTIGEYTVPRLSTVAQSVQMLAQKSIELLQSAMEGGKNGRWVTVPVTLMQRESAAAPKRSKGVPGIP